MDYLEINKKAWNERTSVHVASTFYDVDGFLGGNTSLREIELSGLAEVEGRRLLHLQCHFGLDTLSWARKGAVVTGVDLSSEAIDQANKIKFQAGLNAEFVCADVYHYGQQSTETFDIVYTSYGAICWLPDLTRWAETVAGKLKQGGCFYMVEFHPLCDVLSGYPYFYSSEPDVSDEGTYTENCQGKTNTMVSWVHSLSEVITALIGAGIEINAMSEFPFSPYNCFDDLEERAKGRFYRANTAHDVPLVYSIMGTKK